MKFHFLFLVTIGLCSTPVAAETPSTQTDAAKAGYEFIRSTPLLPTDFDQETFDAVWQEWPEPLRSKAEKATAAERRKMAFERYGLVEPPDGDGNGPALGYVDDGQGGWVMNCLACHGGQVAGQAIPGVPNSNFALQTMTEELRLAKVRLQKPFASKDLAIFNLSLGSTNGTTNAVVFGILLGALRDADMNFVEGSAAPPRTDHDMDAPPFWNVKKKSRLYCDGHSPKNHRVLVQFMLLPVNDAASIKSKEDDFRNVLAWIESLQAPKYPWEIDAELAKEGEAVFNDNCRDCHGSYGQKETYPERVIPIDVVGTDPLRLAALKPTDRQKLAESWMCHYGEDDVDLDPAGYVAPPLDGVWASAPYFHNGSVPTLWHVLHPDQRPTVWRRTATGYDRNRVGLEVESYENGLPSVSNIAERRRYFDTRKPGKSAAGHDFPASLTEPQKAAVLEYLKTL
ncbi:c-type cytochrome [Thalassoroseus pseudoceratinae]|uniref:c-type cytochrome n=1 Tax=Thalassoroseus pseudoceratinae TaxID=2713176 RepID=UPI001F0EBFD1|nr:cytochrome c [Thalassoroseus pseudoceratinae]